MKRILSLIAIILIVFSLSACSENAIETYKTAMENTENLESGKTRTTIKIDNQFDTDNLSEEELDEIEKFENIEITATTMYDRVNQKIQTNLYYKYGNVGYDFLIYITEGNGYIKFPMENKFLEVSKLFKSLENLEELDEDEASSELFNKISDKWLEMLQKDNVVRGGKSVMDTDDGDVKVTEYTIEPSNDQLFMFLFDVIKIIEDNKQALEDFVDFDQNESLDVTFQDILAELEDVSFSYKSYIDIDDYIVSEDINFGYKATKNETDVSIKVEYWENNITQEINLPDFSDDNLLDEDELDEKYKFELGKIGE
jgi:hypothetical protein